MIVVNFGKFVVMLNSKTNFIHSKNIIFNLYFFFLHEYLYGTSWYMNLHNIVIYTFKGSCGVSCKVVCIWSNYNFDKFRKKFLCMGHGTYIKWYLKTICELVKKYIRVKKKKSMSM